jgi:hypothetical protein
MSTGSFVLALQEELSITWIGPDQKPLPFKNLREIEVFLMSAKVVSVEKVEQGITKPRKLLLTTGDVRMHAIFRDVDNYKQRWNGPKGLQLHFHDFYLYECAAYRLSKLLGLKHVPPAIQRKLSREDFFDSKDYSSLNRKEGALQAWVEDAFTEKDRIEKKLSPPDMKSWTLQYQTMLIFDNLIYNLDRNQTNILIGPDWTLWFIDATRAFRPFKDLKEPADIRRCEKDFWERLKTLQDSDLEEHLGDFLPGSVMRGVLERRRKLVARIQERIDQFGEELVLYDLP